MGTERTPPLSDEGSREVEEEDAPPSRRHAGAAGDVRSRP